MKVPPTVTVMDYLKSIAVDGAVASHAASCAEACGMSVARYGATLGMLVQVGLISSTGRTREGDRRVIHYVIETNVVPRHIYERDNAWPQARKEKLRAEWAKGGTSEEIGKRLGVSKNSVVGMAHRMKLPPRMSPIKGFVPKPPKPAPATVTRPPPRAPESVVVAPLPPRHVASPRRSVVTMSGGKGLVLGAAPVWRAGQCRWALACSEPAVRGNWCECHGALLGRKAAA